MKGFARSHFSSYLVNSYFSSFRYSIKAKMISEQGPAQTREISLAGSVEIKVNVCRNKGNVQLYTGNSQKMIRYLQFSENSVGYRPRPRLG